LPYPDAERKQVNAPGEENLEMGEQQMGVTGQGNADALRAGGHPAVDREVIEVKVDYLPAPAPFVRKYSDEIVVETIRTDAMTYFGVKDFQDRNIHKFFLEFEGRVLENTSQTLEQLLGPHRRSAHFNLIERVTQGGLWNGCELPSR
jgi:hypothetical protein